MKVNVNLSFLRVCVNVDYLLLLYEFFVEGLPTNESNQVVSRKVDSPNKKLPKIAEQKLSEFKQEQLNSQQTLVCDIRIENPQFILYENQYELRKTNSLIIDVTKKERI